MSAARIAPAAVGREAIRAIAYHPEGIVLASPERVTIGRQALPVDLGPMAVTCVACRDQALAIMMPGMTGITICRRCSFQERTAE